MIGWIIAGIVVVLVLVYVFTTYNTLVRLRNLVEEAFSTMDVYLKKRWDLIPNLVSVVKGYAKHEKEALTEIVNLRNKAYDNMSTDEKIAANSQLTQNITKLMALSEAYPDLKASENFKGLSSELSSTEKDIANSRKYYNGAVRNLNDKVEMFPSNIIANMFGFKKYKMFDINVSERENVKVEF